MHGRGPPLYQGEQKAPAEALNSRMLRNLENAQPFAKRRRKLTQKWRPGPSGSRPKLPYRRLYDYSSIGPGTWTRLAVMPGWPLLLGAKPCAIREELLAIPFWIGVNTIDSLHD